MYGRSFTMEKIVFLSKELNRKIETMFFDFLSQQAEILKNEWIKLENKDNLPDNEENMQLLSLNRIHMVVYHKSSFEWSALLCKEK